MSERQTIGAGCLGVFVVFLLLLLAYMATVTKNGEVRAIKTFNNYDGTVIEPGLTFVLPWKSAFPVRYEVSKIEGHAENLATKGRLPVALDIVITYKLKKELIPNILREFGEDFQTKTIDMYWQNAVRDTALGFEPEDFYSDKMHDFERLVRAKIQTSLEPKGFEIIEVMIQKPVLPEVVLERVRAKAAAEQDVFRVEFETKKRIKEAEAMVETTKLKSLALVEEAKGLQESQKIIAAELSEAYLVFKWLETLEKMAENKNATTIYIPTGPNGLPTFKEVK